MAGFVFWDFSEDYRRGFKKNQKKIKDRLEVGEELTGYDKIKFGGPEFWNLSIRELEKCLEKKDPQFQKVVNRLERKDNEIMKLS